ncbi:MAG TPA: hypothetical protein VLX91_16570 [Candidatus Acidoferrales bacterium]|nr:hypothetical protein [Candidatus Acidoferrales bacterium]
MIGKLKEALQNKTRLLILLAIIEIALLILSIPFFKLNGDEAWFAEESYFMSQKGYSASNLFSGFLMEDVRIVVQHKLFIYLGAALFKILYFDLWVFRLIPILALVVLVVFMVKYQQNYLAAGGSAGLPSARLQLFLSLCIAFAVHDFVYLAKVGRPDMLVTLLGFISFYLLAAYHRREKYWRAGLAGFFAGLAMLAHLNGIIFVAAGLAVLLLRKKFSASLLFGILAVAAFLPYLLDIYLHYDIFKVQINSPLVITKTEFTLLKPLINMSREHQRLFRKPQIIIPSALFFFQLITNWRKLFDNGMRGLTVYTLLLMFFLGLFVEDKTMKYSTYLIPFWGILIARSMITMDAKRKWIFPANAFLLLALFVTGLFWQVESVFEKENYPPLNRSIAAEMPQHSTCVAPMNFIFNEVANYKILSDYLVGYEGFGETKIESLSDFCRKKNCKYVVFNKYGDEWDYIHDYNDTAGLLKKFEIVAANHDFTILKCRDTSAGEPTCTTPPEAGSAVQQYVSYMAERARLDRKPTDIR